MNDIVAKISTLLSTFQPQNSKKISAPRLIWKKWRAYKKRVYCNRADRRKPMVACERCGSKVHSVTCRHHLTAQPEICLSHAGNVSRRYFPSRWLHPHQWLIVSSFKILHITFLSPQWITAPASTTPRSVTTTTTTTVTMTVITLPKLMPTCLPTRHKPYQTVTISLAIRPWPNLFLTHSNSLSRP